MFWLQGFPLNHHAAFLKVLLLNISQKSYHSCSYGTQHIRSKGKVYFLLDLLCVTYQYDVHAGVHKYLHVINYEKVKLGNLSCPLCAHRKNEKEQVLWCFFYKDTDTIGSGPTFMTSFNLNYSLLQIQSHSVRASTYEFGGDAHCP